MAMGTAYPAHAWHGQNRRRNGTRSQIDNTFTIWPRAGDTLRRTLAYKQTIAWTSDVLLPRWSVSYRRGFITLTAFNDMLIPLAGDIYHRLTDSTGNHRHATLDRGLVRRRQLVRPDRGNGVHVGLCFVDRIAAVRAVRDILVLQQRLPLALLAVSHAERRWDQFTATIRQARFASIV